MNEIKILIGLEKIKLYSYGSRSNMTFFKEECDKIKPLINDKVDNFCNNIETMFEKYFEELKKEMNNNDRK